MKKTAASRNAKRKTSHQEKSSTAGQVRIIGGQFKRRSVSFIDAEGLRPTPDRLRETLFNWLLADIHGAYVLDSCAGSGVLGFEALSRGAAHCTFIEMNRGQSQMLGQSAEQLRLNADTYQIINGTAEQVLMQSHIVPRPFDVVFIDPPYAEDLWQPILATLITQALINTETLIYLEADRDLATQLEQLEETINNSMVTQPSVIQQPINFECLKQTKVGQVVAGLFRLSSS
ncbi:16S rRNA (guanine(966)-N(2))-methyltransferase RsmD [Psychrobacter glaciei]|uniref:16S rRNA (guanine(966)-N(2))-methyltransferase RsmD n=1 Tax=Psychrobacter glaciei TaxID=619771 RepID=UPI003F4879F0